MAASLVSVPARQIELGVETGLQVSGDYAANAAFLVPKAFGVLLEYVGSVASSRSLFKSACFSWPSI